MISYSFGRSMSLSDILKNDSIIYNKTGDPINGSPEFLYKKKTPRLTRGSVNATHLTKNPPCLRIIMRSANCIKVKKED